MSIKEKMNQQTVQEQEDSQREFAAEQARIKQEEEERLESPASREKREALRTLVERKIAEIVKRTPIREVFSEAADLVKGKITDNLSTPWPPEARLPKEQAEAWLVGYHEAGFGKTITLTWTQYSNDKDPNPADPLKNIVGPGLLDRIIHLNDNAFEPHIYASVGVDGITIGELFIEIPQGYDKDVLESAVLVAIKHPSYPPSSPPAWNGPH